MAQVLANIGTSKKCVLLLVVFQFLPDMHFIRNQAAHPGLPCMQALDFCLQPAMHHSVEADLPCRYPYVFLQGILAWQS